MADELAPPTLFFAPFVSSTMGVEPAWLDYNGHLNMAYYHVLFDRAVDEAFELVGLGVDYLREANCSYFVAEIHTLYKREVSATDTVRVTLQLIDHDEKRLHFYQRCATPRRAGWRPRARTCPSTSIWLPGRCRPSRPESTTTLRS